jgi:anaerobic selenocysteine-containing dehydrogenase
MRSPYDEPMNVAAISTRTVTGVCPHDCPDSCGWVVTVEDRIEGPVPVSIRGNPNHPYSKGELCPKVNRYLHRVLSEDRVLTPLRRTGPKGSGQFEQISWDEALHEIALRWTEIISTAGPGAIVPFYSAGNQSELASNFPVRLLGALGTAFLTGSVCGLTAGAGTALTYGSGLADDPAELRFAKQVFLWGNNTRLTNRHLWPYVEEARGNGATIVVIDALRTITAESADVFVQPLPGTDVALILAMLHVLITENLIDRDYLAAHSSGFDELATHVETWTPERAAAMCGVDADKIVSLARRYADGPSFIRTLIGPEHSEQGATFFRTLAMLPVLTGAWKQRGGGYARSIGTQTSSTLNPVVTREHVTNGFARMLQYNHIGRWLNETNPADIVRSLIVWGANPLVTIPNSEATRRGLEREDLFTVVHEQFLTDTARYADIVLPATTQIESDDVNPSWGSPHVNYNHAAIPPRGQARSNTETFRCLAAALGRTEPWLFESDEELLAGLFSGRAVSLERIRSEGTVTVDLAPQYYANGGFATSDGRAALASADLEVRGLGRVPAYAATTADPTHPFHLLTPKTHTRFLNSSYSQLPGHVDREGEPFVELCPSDADVLGLSDGDTALVSNDRATLTLTVRISERVRPGVVAIPFGWTSASHRGGTANSLTSDTLVDHGGSVAYNDTHVAVHHAS